MPVVTLEPCGAERAETLQNLFQFYVHDFADFWETRRTELQEDGRFGLYPPLPRYWTDPSCSAFLIRADGNLAGFVLLDGQAHSGQACDFNVGEFFVARHYRREASAGRPRWRRSGSAPDRGRSPWRGETLGPRPSGAAWRRRWPRDRSPRSTSTTSAGTG